MNALEQAFLRDYDMGSEHRALVHAPVAKAYQAILQMDLSESRVVRLLFGLRGLPRSALTLQGLERVGFIRLVTEDDRAILLGIAGRFWTPSGEIERLSPEGFRAFDRRGWAKATWGFRVASVDADVTEVITSTQVRCYGGKARALFRAYWVVIGPLSAWIRREALRVIKRRAER